MCLAIFIAADHPLPISPEEQHKARINVIELRPTDEAIRKQFSNPYIYEVLGKEGCACDFDYDPTWGELLPEETERARTNLLKLAAYLREASNVGGPLELYAGFCDEMALPPTSRGAITPEQLLLCRLNQSERKFFTISRSNNQR